MANQNPVDRINLRNENNLSKERFLELLLAVHNIGPEVEPGTEEGQKATAGALRTVDTLFEFLERQSEPSRVGAELVLRLYVECQCAFNPEWYAQHEAVRAFGGARVEDEGATIQLPRDVRTHQYAARPYHARRK